MLTKYIFIILIQLAFIQVGFGQKGEPPKSPPTNKIQPDVISINIVKAPNDFDKLVFEFKDSSVNPESQRNYKIIFTKKSAEIVLKSYKVLDRETIKISDEQFNNIIKIVQNAQLKNRSNLDDGGCSGGTTDIFEFFSNEKSTFKGFVYHCGGENFGDLVGNSDTVKNALTALFPTVKVKFRN